MRAAEVTEAVWTALLASRRGAPVSPSPNWSPAARAAWSLYAPLAAANGPSGPYVFAQVGQSLDGRIATPSGDAADVSGPGGLRHLHRCRALADAVVIGVCTALADSPRLTVRHVRGADPARVVLDPRGRLPDDATPLRDDGARRIVVQSVARARPPGVEVISLPERGGRLDPRAIRDALAAIGLRRILVEGGGTTIRHFLEDAILDRLHVAISPLIIGAGPSGLRTSPVPRLADALRPETFVYGLETDVVFDCALGAGSDSRSTWPTVIDAAAEAPVAATRA